MHQDREDVYIFGLHGHTCYLIDKKPYVVSPGDMIWIKNGIPHQSIGLTPRIIASFGIY